MQMFRSLVVVSSLGLIAAFVSGCSGAGSPTAAPPPNVPLSVFTTTSFSQTVVLPTGSTLTPDKLTVIDSVGTTTPASSGAFTLTAYNNGEQIAILLSPSGNPMLMGWMDANHTTISASTTAEVLAYYALGGYLLLTDAERAEYIAQIPQQPAFPALVQAIATEIAANPDAFAATDPAVKSALNAYFTSLTGIVPASQKSTASPKGILVNPTSAQSGLTVIQTPPSSAYLSNAYRRRSHAFVTRVSETLAGTTTPDPEAVSDFEIQPTSGVNGGVTGTIIDIFNAYYGNQPTEYAPINSDPFSVPLVAGNDTTNYQVLVVGPGGQNLGAVNSLTAAQETARLQVSVSGFAQDALVPFLSNFALGSGFLPDTTRLPSATVAEFKANLADDLVEDFVALIGSSPQLQAEVEAGDYRSAMQDLYTLGVNGSTFNGLYMDAMTKASSKLVSAGFTAGPMSTALMKFNVILNAAGGVLQVFDTGVYGTQIAGSDAVDTWTVATGATKVTLSPAATTLNGLGSVALVVALPGTTVTGYSYMWTVTPGVAANGLIGDLTEVGGAGRTGQTSYCSSSPNATYINTSSAVSNLTQAATDTVTVTAFEAASCVAGSQVGQPATATVTTQPSSGLVNGDFSNGLNGWTVFSSSGVNGSPYVYINTSCYYSATQDDYPAQEGNPFVQMQAVGDKSRFGTYDYIQQTFTVPANAKTLSLRAWNNLDPVYAVISIIDSSNNVTVLDTFTPPSIQGLSNPNNAYSVVATGNIAVTKTYDISAYAGKSITLRLEADGYPTGENGYFLNYDDVTVK